MTLTGNRTLTNSLTAGTLRLNNINLADAAMYRDKRQRRQATAGGTDPS